LLLVFLLGGSSGTPWGLEGIKVGVGCGAYIKKAWESLSLVPRAEALALPGTVERATQRPTPICVDLKPNWG